MCNKGFFSVSAALLFFCFSSLAIGFLSVMRFQRPLVEQRLQEMKAIILIHGVSMITIGADFNNQLTQREWGNATIEAERLSGFSSEKMSVQYHARLPRFSKTVKIDWERIGSEWRATAWREPL